MTKQDVCKDENFQILSPGDWHVRQGKVLFGEHILLAKTGSRQHGR